jgi:hypothetical protein
MSQNHRPGPRQNVHRARNTVGRHAGHPSVGTSTDKQRRAIAAKKGKTRLTSQQQAGSYYARAANRAGRLPLA